MQREGSWSPQESQRPTEVLSYRNNQVRSASSDRRPLQSRHRPCSSKPRGSASALINRMSFMNAAAQTASAPTDSRPSLFSKISRSIQGFLDEAEFEEFQITPDRRGTALVEALKVATAKSPHLGQTDLQPPPAPASRAMPMPLIPPPITNRS